MAELDSVKGIGLVEKVRRGLGKPDIIYAVSYTHLDVYKRQAYVFGGVTSSGSSILVTLLHKLGLNMVASCLLYTSKPDGNKNEQNKPAKTGDADSAVPFMLGMAGCLGAAVEVIRRRFGK